MKEIDYLSLDGRSLRTFLVVLEEISVSRAADRLGVTQSAVSHQLDKLRIALGDPLFVRSGRNIVPTERAIALREPIRSVLDELKELTDQRLFDPLIGSQDWTVAANDFQRDLIFPRLLKDLRREGVDARFHFIPSGIPTTDLLRQGRCQLLVTPFPPEGPDIFQTRLFEDRLVCYYDSKVRQPPGTLKEYLEADYIEVSFADNESAYHHLSDVAALDLKKPSVSVPGFTAVSRFLKGTDLITTQLSLMARINLLGFATAPLPFKTRKYVMYLAWHKRDHTDPAHQWLRQRIKCITEAIQVVD